MKTIELLCAILILITTCHLSAQVAVNSDGSAADASAMLDVKSSTKGFLPPRMTQAQRDAIGSPAIGLIIYCTDCVEMQIYNGTEWVNIMTGTVTVPVVINPTTEETWMDRNLGASRVANSLDDADAYGDLYQWGRDTEGHESRTSGTTTTIATTAVPDAGNSWDALFIIASASPFDWLTSQDNTLWQSVNGTNNPCPADFRLPTDTEWDTEQLSWSSNNSAGAYGSPLKLTAGGYRSLFSGSIDNASTRGYYWSSTTITIYARYLYFYDAGAMVINTHRAQGMAVRCIKD